MPVALGKLADAALQPLHIRECSMRVESIGLNVCVCGQHEYIMSQVPDAMQVQLAYNFCF